MGKKKTRAPFPIYCVSEFQRPANCDEGEDCNPAENPAHHVLIDLSPEVRAIITEAGEYLAAGERGPNAVRIAKGLAAILANAEEK